MKKWKLYELNFLLFFIIAFINTQIIPYLKVMKYSIVERGYMIAGMAIITIFGQIVFGVLCDKYNKTKPFFLIGYSMMFVSSFLLFLKHSPILLYDMILVSISGGMVHVMMGLDETWMLEIDENKYGFLRAAGAIGLSVGAIVVGGLLKKVSFSMISIGISISTILFLFIFFKLKDQHKKQIKLQVADLKELAHNHYYVYLILIYLCIYIIGTADQYVVVNKMLQLHIDSTMIGLKWAVQSFMEIPLFLFASKLLKKFNIYHLLSFGTIMYAIKFILYGLFQSAVGIIMTTTLQVVTLPLIMMTSKILIKKVSSEQLFHSAQMIGMAIFIGISSLITPIITSYLCKVFGVDTTLYIIAVFSIIPLLMIYHFMKMMK